MFDKLREKLIRPNENSKAYRTIFSKQLDGKSIRYVTERTEQGEEKVIGHQGTMLLRGKELLVICEHETVFRADPRQLCMNPLMSLDGVILRGMDRITGMERCIAVYYLYYRK